MNLELLTTREQQELENKIEQEGFISVLENCYNNMDCTKVYKDGSRPLMTNCYLYLLNVEKVAYITNLSKEQRVYNDLKEMFDKISKRVSDNIAFELENPPIVYKKEKKSKSKKVGKYTTKDMFTGEIVEEVPKVKKAKKKIKILNINFDVR